MIKASSMFCVVIAGRRKLDSGEEKRGNFHDWFGELIWLSLVDPKLEEGDESEN